MSSDCPTVSAGGRPPSQLHVSRFAVPRVHRIPIKQSWQRPELDVRQILPIPPPKSSAYRSSAVRRARRQISGSATPATFSCDVSDCSRSDCHAFSARTRFRLVTSKAARRPATLSLLPETTARSNEHPRAATAPGWPGMRGGGEQDGASAKRTAGAAINQAIKLTGRTGGVAIPRRKPIG